MNNGELLAFGIHPLDYRLGRIFCFSLNKIRRLSLDLFFCRPARKAKILDKRIIEKKFSLIKS